METTTAFVLPGSVAIPADRALDLLVAAADAGYGPVLSTEVCGVSATALGAALGARRPGVVAGTAIVALGACSEPALAMAATTAAQIAGAPFLLGVGTSTPQIMTGWHGVAYDASLDTTRARVRALRAVLRGQRRGSFQLPVPDADVPVLLAALGPRMTELALDEADGVILNLTPPAAVPRAPDTARVLAFCWVRACADSDARIRRQLVFYMVTDAYGRHLARMGHGEAVERVRALHRDGRLREAPAALPAELVDTIAVTPAGLGDRVRAYHAAGATPVILPVTGDHPADEIGALLAAGAPAA